MKLWEYIRGKMLEHPQQTIGEKNVTMRYEEVVIFAEKFASRIRGLPCCAIYCQSEMATSIALLACFAADVTALPLSERYGEKHCKKILNKIQPPAFIMDAFGELTAHTVQDGGYEPPTRKPALIMCTSGTTGEPKGIMLSERNLLTNINDITQYFGITPEDTILIARPLYHSAVLTGEFLTALVKGTRILFCSEVLQPPLLYQLICQKEITAFCGTPTILNMLTHFKRYGQTDLLKHIVISGECMSREVGEKIRRFFPTANIYHVYGLTEASPRVSYLPPEHFDAVPDAVGIPLASVKLRIQDEHGQTVPDGESGILWVRGGNIMQGYYQDPEQTSSVLKNKWLCTGDIAYKDPNGWLHIKGRNDDMIIRAGMNIYPQEIEATLKKDTRTKDVLIYGKQGKNGDMQICMKISGDFVDVPSIRALCCELLPTFQVPTEIQLVEELPKSGSGKIIRGDQHA